MRAGGYLILMIGEARMDNELSPERLGEGVRFERIRRITGYLVGDLSRWNSGKFAEQADRVKHTTDK